MLYELILSFMVLLPDWYQSRAVFLVGLMATGNKNQVIAGNDHDFHHLKASITVIEHCLDELMCELREAVALIGQVRQAPLLPL